MKSIPTPETLAAMVSSVTKTMFGISFDFASSGPPAPIQDTSPWRTAVLPITGKQPIRVAIASDSTGGPALAGMMFACSAADADAAMVDDSLGELVNIVAGQVKTAMGLDQALGLPKVTVGAARGDGWRGATLHNGAKEVRVWVAVTEGLDA